jgi:hypothetical protein
VTDDNDNFIRINSGGETNQLGQDLTLLPTHRACTLHALKHNCTQEQQRGGGGNTKTCVRACREHKARLALAIYVVGGSEIILGMARPRRRTDRAPPPSPSPSRARGARVFIQGVAAPGRKGLGISKPGFGTQVSSAPGRYCPLAAAGMLWSSPPMSGM